MKKQLAIILGMILTLFGCSRDSSGTEEILGCSKENCILVYDGVEYITYDTTSKQRTGKISTKENDFQYRLSKHDQYITYGNSVSSEFKIMKRVNERLETIYVHPSKTEAIFPFAYVKDEPIFAVMDYDGDKQKFIGLFHLKKNQLEQLPTKQNEKTKKIFGIGISANDQIYTLLHEDGVQNLYKTNINLSKFELIAKDVTQNLSTLYGDVCYMKDQTLYCGKQVLTKLQPKTVLAWVVGDQYILEVDDIGNYEVRAVKDKQLLLSGNKFIGFDEKSSEVRIYSEGKMEKLGD
ncbi:hypothetical protein HW35_08565 [Bacillus sp. X1(2014)]|nr:hypothetical protein HW35_08565 [Bacillus sp. X1(2014)]